MCTSLLFLIASLQQVPAKAPDEPLHRMIATAESYSFVHDKDSRSPLRLQKAPAFRMGKQPADNVMEGAIFFWTGADGRPEAAAQIFAIQNSEFPEGLWIHEFISFSPLPFHGVRDGSPSWSPRSPGVKFLPVPGAPMPAESASQRTRQMKALAQGFHASDNFKDKNWVELRLLPTPIARYGKPGSPVADGALFSFVTGTDPEAFLFLEARPGQGGLRWEYAFAPMTCYELKGSHKGKTVWTIPYRKDAEAHDPARPYYVTAETP
jgi:hypothetical protein